MHGFAVDVRTGRDTTIALRGELDLATVKRFAAVCDSIDYASVTRVVLDLRELVFIDATGLRAVLRLHALCLEQSRELLVRPGSRGVQRVFELTNTHRLLSFEPSETPEQADAPGAREWRISDSR